MCKFFQKCNRPCKSYRTHFIHWKHVNEYCRMKDESFYHYNLYSVLKKYNIDSDSDYDHRKEWNGMVIVKHSPLINYEKFENYKIQKEVRLILNNILDRIC